MGRRDAVLRDGAEPPHLMRWVGDDRVLVAGADAERRRPGSATK